MNAVIRTLDQAYLGNSITQWWWALVIAMAVLLATLLIKRLVRRYRRIQPGEKTGAGGCAVKSSGPHQLYLSTGAQCICRNAMADIVESR